MQLTGAADILLKGEWSQQHQTLARLQQGKYAPFWVMHLLRNPALAACQRAIITNQQ